MAPGSLPNWREIARDDPRFEPELARNLAACGAKVTIKHGGRFLRTRVIDRGPFAHGAKWDLTGAAARRLGVETTTTIRTAIVR